MEAVPSHDRGGGAACHPPSDHLDSPMSLPPVDGLCAPLSGDAPSGPNLEYDPVFQALERAAQPIPETEMGESKKEAEPPQWKEMRKLSLELFERTRDLRVGVFLAQAALHTDGWEGFGQAMEVLYKLVDTLWDSVHPELDADDDNDPMFRLNTLAILKDGDATLNWVREATLVELRGVGRFSARDVALARGQIQPREGEDVAASSAVEGAFADCPLEELEASAAGARHALEMWQAIDASLTARLGAGGAIDLSPLTQELQAIAALLDEPLARRSGGVAPGAEPAPGAETAAAAGAAAHAGAAPAAVVSAPPGVNSREDVIRSLDLILDYYARSEPSSPVPILCERAKALVRKDFMEILKDLLPDAVDDAEKFQVRSDDD